ncbi:IS4 family transposase [Vibrio astriarenae]
MLFEELAFVREQFPLHDNLHIFNAPLPKQWLKEALELSGSVTLRRRKLPAEDIVRLVVGMSLMRNESIHSVANLLAFSSKSLNNNLLAARSSLSNARQRLGAEPLIWLFNQCADNWATQTQKDDLWNGLQLFAIDGTTLRTEDTSDCRDGFGSTNTNTKYQSNYPGVRLTCLMNLRNQLMVRAAVGGFKDSEITMASQMLDVVPDKSVLIMDKLYHSAELLTHLENNGKERYWMAPMRKDIKYSVKETYAENDLWVERELSSHARKRCPELPRKWQFRLIRYQIEGFPPRQISTNLPHGLYSDEDIIKLYHERWNIELGYREIKKGMLNNAITLRSKKAELVYQEVYGLLLAYNLVRHEMALTADVVKLRPSRISFKAALRIVVYDYYGMATTGSMQKIPARMKDLTDTLKDFILPEPERPDYPRAVKSNFKKYPLKSAKRLKEKP